MVSEICCWLTFMFFKKGQQSPTQGPPEREVCMGVQRRGNLRWWWPSRNVTMEKSFYLMEKFFFHLHVLRPWRGIHWVISDIRLNQKAAVIQKNILPNSASRMVPRQLLDAWYDRGFFTSLVISHSQVTWARRGKKQGFVSSKHGRINGTFLMNHKEKKIQPLLTERSKSWEASCRGFCLGFLPFDLEIEVVYVPLMLEG